MSWKPDFDGVTFVGVEKYTNQDTPSMCTKMSIQTKMLPQSLALVTEKSIQFLNVGFAGRKAMRMFAEYTTKENGRVSDLDMHDAIQRARREAKSMGVK